MMEVEPEIVLETASPEVQAARKVLPFSFAKRHGVLIRELTSDGADAVYRADASPLSIAEVRRYMGVPLKLSRVSPDIFDSLLQASYEQGSQKAMEMVGGLDDEFDLTQVAQELEPSDLLESDDDAPIIRFINAVLTEAIKENASDVHIEPYENRLGVRFRVDGVLHDVLHTRRALAPLVVSRIKVMSKLDIAEKRLPQDGRISLRIAGRAEIRPATRPKKVASPMLSPLAYVRPSRGRPAATQALRVTLHPCSPPPQSPVEGSGSSATTGTSTRTTTREICWSRSTATCRCCRPTCSSCRAAGRGSRL